MTERGIKKIFIFATLQAASRIFANIILKPLQF